MTTERERLIRAGIIRPFTTWLERPTLRIDADTVPALDWRELEGQREMHNMEQKERRERAAEAAA